MKNAGEYFNGMDLNMIKPEFIVGKFTNEFPLESIVDCSCESVFDDFVQFCGGESPIGKKTFYRLLSDVYPLETKPARINGSVVRVFILT